MIGSSGRFAAMAAAGLLAWPAAGQEVSEYAGDVRRLAETDLQAWITDPFVVYALREQNERHAEMSMARVEALDTRWREERAAGSTPMIDDLLGRQASVVLRDRRAMSEGVITEIILMDRYGLNVAISDPTSDYYQGDEAKWIETFLEGPGAVHVSEVYEDESTGVNQTQVSLTIADSDDPSRAIGAVTFGVNLFVLRTRGS